VGFPLLLRHAVVPKVACVSECIESEDYGLAPRRLDRKLGEQRPRRPGQVL